MNKEQLAESREVDYRLSKWIITNIEQLLSPEEIEEIWRELLSFYSPPTASVENVCGTMTGNGLGKYVVPSKSDMIVDEYAQEYLSGLLVGHPLAVLDDNLSQELERVRIELEAAQKRIIELQDEKADLLERAIKAEAAKALTETNTRDQAARIEALEGEIDGLKKRTLWQRITRWGEK